MKEFISKKELRARMRQHNAAFTATQRTAASAAIFRRVEALPQFASARCVALFAALGDEPSTAEVLVRWSATKRLVVPKVEGDTMRFYKYNPSILVRGAFGIQEPGMGSPLCDPGDIDLMIVPGTAFSPSGCRLGRGKGYYDKYLSQHHLNAYKVGVCFRHQLVDELPSEAHDVRMDTVCAE